ncbi:unnamed protein product [marine sediment metagenome]|uniref:Uncharacterized protein n=1 Tax=marine sediment metagenome TaxID=412755 RepID=X1I3S9_9ZZZZ
MKAEKTIEEYNPDNGIYPLCACGCGRPILYGDEVIWTSTGNTFLLCNSDRESWLTIKKKLDNANLTEEWKELDDELLACKRCGCKLIKLKGV